MQTCWGLGPAAGDSPPRPGWKEPRKRGLGSRSTSGKPPGVLMVPWQHFLRLSQSHQGGCSEHPGLAHAPTQGFTEAPGFLDEVLGPPNQGPHWCTQALGETEGHRVTVLHDVGRGHTQSHGCIHQSSSIQVDTGPMGLGQEVHLW